MAGRCAILHREQLDDSSMRLILQEMKAGHCPKKKDRCQAQQSTVATFIRPPSVWRKWQWTSRSLRTGLKEGKT
jgi:hypothetical protein